jgi:AraC-like DNA-binding protein
MPPGCLTLSRAPRPILQPYVEKLWAVDATGEVRPPAAHREHVLPTGQMHLAIRLTDDPLTVFRDADDRTGRRLGCAVVGGARVGHYIRDVSRPLCSVGAQLHPGGAEALFGVPAEVLAGVHTPLDDLWGREAAWVREQLMEPPMLHQRIDRLESILVARLSTRRVIHPVVPYTVEQLRRHRSIQGIVRDSGYSHRMVITLFRRSVGLTPKQFDRVMRFEQALGHVRAADGPALVEIALSAGYSDQAHFSREFKTIAGVTPSEYRRAAPEEAHHFKILQDTPLAARHNPR